MIALVIVSVQKSGFERIALMQGGKAMHPANGFIARLSNSAAAVVTAGDAVNTGGASRPLEIELVYSSEADDGNVIADAATVYSPPATPTCATPLARSLTYSFVRFALISCVDPLLS